jgi:NAD-dependent deacetylase
VQPSIPLRGTSERDSVETLVAMAQGNTRIVAFTGAGISTESGIPDYRGPNGVWATQKPPTIGDFRTNLETRRDYWLSRLERYPRLARTEPNAGHSALVRLHESGVLEAIVTQNIDGLHQRAGMPDDRVIELHGNALRVKCLECERQWDATAIHDRQVAGELVPDCEICGGPLRAATVLFGEALPEGALDRALALATACDLILVVGSSLVVQPAAKVPLVAKRKGAALAIVTLEPTPLDNLADVVVNEPAGATLSSLAAALVHDTG